MVELISHKEYEILYALFNTVYGLGEQSIPPLIEAGARTINDLKNKYSGLLLKKPASKKYLKYYDELQERIPRSEICDHETYLKKLLSDFKIDIVGSFRRGAETSGDIDVLFTTINNKTFSSTVNYIDVIKATLTSNHYLLDTLKSGKSVMNGIVKLNTASRARRIDFFFSHPDLYQFALLAKTGDVDFNKSLRHCVGEKNTNKDNPYLLSEYGIRYKDVNDNKKFINVVDPANFSDVPSIFKYTGIPSRDPKDMIGHFPCNDTDERRKKKSTSSSSKKKSTRSSSKKSMDHKKRKVESSSSRTYLDLTRNESNSEQTIDLLDFMAD